MSWLKKLFGGDKTDQPHEGHENCEGGVCKPEEEATPEKEAPATEEKPTDGGEEATKQGEEEKPL